MIVQCTVEYVMYQKMSRLKVSLMCRKNKTKTTIPPFGMVQSDYYNHKIES
jgi:hypothetical protein